MMIYILGFTTTVAIMVMLFLVNNFMGARDNIESNEDLLFFTALVLLGSTIWPFTLTGLGLVYIIKNIFDNIS